MLLLSADGADRFLHFLREAKRRKVYITAVGYVAVALVMKEVGELVVDATGAPAVTTRIVSILLLLGFPVVLVLAWLFDVTSSGIRRTEPLPRPSREAAGEVLAAAALPRMPERARPRATPEVVASSVAEPDPLRVKRAALGHMRHELRTPINGILGYSEMLLEDVTDEAVAADLRRIREAGRTLLTLIDGMLHPDHLLSGGVERTLDSFGAQVAADLRTPINTVIGYTELLIEGCRENGRDELVPDLERVHDSARRLLELSGDIVRLATSAGGAAAGDGGLGSSSALAETVLSHIRPVSTVTAVEGEGTLLVVDDNALNRELLSRQLARHGYIVETAADGVEALERLNGRDYDVILLDVIMPRMDGVEALRRIRENERLADVPVLMLSSLDETDSAIRCLELGAEEYLTRPFQPTLLEARIAANVALRRMRARDHAYEAHLQSMRQTLSQLAHAVFPAHIAVRVLRGERRIVESFPEVTVLCALLPRDARTVAAGGELAGRLQELHAHAERARAAHGVQAQINRPFGVDFLCGAGSPAEQHAEIAARVALELLANAAAAGTALCIALHTGAVVAGVIGEQGVHYEAWGEGVDTAEALALGAAAGTIVVSPTTHTLLRGRHRLEPRGVAEVAGRGHMKLHVLRGPEASAGIAH